MGIESEFLEIEDFVKRVANDKYLEAIVAIATDYGYFEDLEAEIPSELEIDLWKLRLGGQLS